MNLLVALLQIYTPEYVRKRALTELFRFTASAFDAEVPPLARLNSQACLEQYARFTQSHARAILDDGDEVQAVEQRLYRNAVMLGQRHGRLLRIHTRQDVMALGRVLYRILDIDLYGDAQGEVTIGHCYFSRFYSGEVCRLMSAMDRGLFAGLSDGGQLVFTARLTEGQSHCRAHLDMESEGPG